MAHQIIQTIEELDDLDPLTHLMDRGSVVLPAFMWLRGPDIDRESMFPLGIIEDVLDVKSIKKMLVDHHQQGRSNSVRTTRRATFQERMEAVEDMRATPGAWVKIPTWGDPVTAVHNQRHGKLRYLPPGEFESAIVGGVAVARVIVDA